MSFHFDFIDFTVQGRSTFNWKKSFFSYHHIHHLRQYKWHSREMTTWRGPSHWNVCWIHLWLGLQEHVSSWFQLLLLSNLPQVDQEHTPALQPSILESAIENFIILIASFCLAKAGKKDFIITNYFLLPNMEKTTMSSIGCPISLRFEAETVRKSIKENAFIACQLPSPTPVLHL